VSHRAAQSIRTHDEVRLELFDATRRDGAHDRARAAHCAGNDFRDAGAGLELRTTSRSKKKTVKFWAVDADHLVGGSGASTHTREPSPTMVDGAVQVHSVADGADAPTDPQVVECSQSVSGERQSRSDISIARRSL